MSETGYSFLRDIGREFGVEIHRPGIHQLHFLVRSSSNLMRFCTRLREENCFLVTLIGNDERELEDDCFKLYYIFSHPMEDVFLAIEYSLPPGRDRHPSIFPIYPSVEPFERELADLLGLLPEQPERRVDPQSYLHSCYPAELYPLRRDWSQDSFKEMMHSGAGLALPDSLEEPRRAPDGELFLPVGPIHAGVIEPGNFTFRISGEIIEGLELKFGYAHRGVERLYQRSYDLCTGWKLAERVAGDSSFAHSVAYSKAIEVMSGTAISEEAKLLRALFLEVERITNHIGNCAELAQDLAIETTGAEMAVLREKMMRLCGALSGSRFLRGVNRPGGMILPCPIDTVQIRAVVHGITGRFLALAQMLVERPDFRDRTIGAGLLPRDTAFHLGITGLAARASGLQRDFRRQHPFGPYTFPEIQALLAEPPLNSLDVAWEMNGDVFSRFLQRVLEVDVSQKLVEQFLDCWAGENQVNFCAPVNAADVPNFEWGLGYVEGWRGDIVYWVMKDKFERIYRCKVRDPSTLNWPGLQAAVAPDRPGAENTLGDFPLINKSFNLSYAGNDL